MTDAQMARVRLERHRFHGDWNYTIPALVLDLLLIAAVGASIAIAITGGADFALAGRAIRAHSVGNLLIFAYGLAALRFLARRWSPFLGVPAWPVEGVEARTGAALRRAHAWLIAIDMPRAQGIAIALALSVLAVKVAIAWRHFGFVTGDDVEIQEMTFARLFHWNWRAWDLRSPFYPMTFIYPLQRVLVSLGVTATMPLVLAGRLVVAVLSTLSLLSLHRIATRSYGAPVAVLAVGFLALSGLQIAFGSTELPRPVSTVLVLAAFGCVSQLGWYRTFLAGTLLGIAAAMRFSEMMFVVPATIQLALERRWRDVTIVVAAMLLIGGGIQVVSDSVYWGSPFASLLRIVDFTFVQRLSSRGYQSVWYYASAATSWSDVFTVGMAVYATRLANWRVALWAWLPLVMLSGLPHKEPRYVLPMIPFIALLAALGSWRLLGRVTRLETSRGSTPVLTVALAAGVCGCVLFQVASFHVHRSDAQVLLAQELDSRGDVERLAIEQSWRMGGRLYLRHIDAVVDLDPEVLSESMSRESAQNHRGGLWLAMSTSTCRRIDCASRLLALGFHEQALHQDAARSGYVVFAQ